ncbi:MAG: OsmC family protein [Candidatus Dormibacteraeota bacterium]|nr:OsmC family protein [Candidatus Dormibacteraeota bacterium]
MFRVETRTLDGQATAVGGAGPHSVIVDRPIEAGGGGRGFNGGQLLHLAVAGCVSNDLFREAERSGIRLSRVVVTVDGDFDGDPPVSTGITYEVDVEGEASTEDLDALVRHVDAVAEIPNSLRRGTPVQLRNAKVHQPFS